MNLTRPTVLASALAIAALASGAAAATADAAEPGTPLLPATCIGVGTAGGECTAFPGGSELNGGGDIVVTPDGRFAYATAYYSNKISIFSRDAETGRFTPAGTLDNGQKPGALELSEDGRHLYVAGTGTGIVRSSIRAYARNEQTGALGQVGCVAEVTGGSLPGCVSRQGLRGASDVELSPDGDSLYVAARAGGGDGDGNGTPDGALTQLMVDPVGGGFTGGNCYPAVATGSGDCSGTAYPHLDDVSSITIPSDGRHVYAAGRSITVLNRIVSGPDQGAISGGGECWQNNDSNGCGAAYALSAGVSDVIASPDGQAVYATTGGDSAQALVTFARDETSGELTFAKCHAASPLAGYCEPQGTFLDRGLYDVDFSTDGRTVYLVGGTGDPGNRTLLVAFRRNTTTNELTPVACTAGNGPACADSSVVGTITAIATTPDARGLAFRALHIGNNAYDGYIGSVAIEQEPIAEPPAPAPGDDGGAPQPPAPEQSQQPGQQQPQQPAPPAKDTLAPLLKSLKLGKKRLVVGAATTLSGRVSEAGTLELRGMKKRARRWVATGTTVRVKVAAGKASVKLSKTQLRRLGASKAGAYRLAVVPVDAAGNRGAQRVVSFSVVRKRR